MPIVTKAEFARLAGVTPSAISSAIEAGLVLPAGLGRRAGIDTDLPVNAGYLQFPEHQRHDGSWRRRLREARDAGDDHEDLPTDAGWFVRQSFACALGVLDTSTIAFPGAAKELYRLAKKGSQKKFTERLEELLSEVRSGLDQERDLFLENLEAGMLLDWLALDDEGDETAVGLANFTDAERSALTHLHEAELTTADSVGAPSVGAAEKSRSPKESRGGVGGSAQFRPSKKPRGSAVGVPSERAANVTQKSISGSAGEGNENDR